MNRVFDYNGAAVSHSKPVKQLKTVKKMVVVDSGDRDIQKYPYNGDFVVYLPRVYENVVSIRLAGAEFPAKPYVRSGGTSVDADTQLYYMLDIEGLNKIDECSVGADRSGYPDGIFAKIQTNEKDTKTNAVFYNDHSAPENIGHYSPAIGKLDRMHIRTRLHSHKQSGDYIYWNGPSGTKRGEFSLTFEIEMLDNVFDDFSSFESRIAERG
jgi:hypothetical protein